MADIDHLRGQIFALQFIVNRLGVGKSEKEIRDALTAEEARLSADSERERDYYLGFASIALEFPKLHL